MNTSATSPSSAASCDRASAPKDAREPSDPLACDAFEQVLQSRQRQQRSGSDSEEQSREPAQPLMMPALVLSPAQT
ncbi:MAG TPA: hypothetical protein VIY30_08140, partial [Burkholderiaceae bacterium]